MTTQRTLTQEIMSHQCRVIGGSIYAFKKEITDNPLFNDVFLKTKPNSNMEEHLDIPRRIVEYTRLYDKDRLNRIYDFCWEKVKDYIPDDKVYEKEYEIWNL